jgi:AcrR family transcriptional regulator
MGVEPMQIKAGSAAVPMPGYDVHILRPDGSECAPGEEGAICLQLPLPPGALPTLWADDDRYVASYLSEHPGYYLSGDGGYMDEDGYLFVMGRTDDVINVAGHRLSTGAIEATATLMQRHGVAGTGIAEILATSGVTRRSIYLNFPGGKAELVAAATRSAGDEMTTTLRDYVAQPDPIGAFTRMWSDVLVSTDFEGGCPIVAAASSRDESPEATSTAAEVFAERAQLLAERLRGDGVNRAAAQSLSTMIGASVEVPSFFPEPHARSSHSSRSLITSTNSSRSTAQLKNEVGAGPIDRAKGLAEFVA